MYSLNLTNVIIPNGVKVIAFNAFGGSTSWLYDNNDFGSIYIPESVTSIEERAFYQSKVDKIIFRGATPTLGANWITLGSSTLGDVRVPSEHYDAYQLAYPQAFMVAYNINWKPVNKPYDGTWYDKELTINSSDINPISDFVFTFNHVSQSYTLLDYTNTTDRTLVIPKYYTDGLPIDTIAKSAMSPGNANPNQLTDVVFPNSIRVIDDLAFSGSSF